MYASWLVFFYSSLARFALIVPLNLNERLQLTHFGKIKRIYAPVTPWLSHYWPNILSLCGNEPAFNRSLQFCLMNSLFIDRQVLFSMELFKNASVQMEMRNEQDI